MTRSACLAPLFASLLVACAACHHRTTGADGGAPCQTTADCSGGKVCIAGACSNCNSDAQCRPKEQCDPSSLLCTLRSGWGDQCQLNSDCKAGQVCHQGLCTSQGDVTFCLNPNAPDACPAGQRCNFTNLVCEQDLGCYSDADCISTEICNLGTHECEPRCTTDNQSTVCAVGFKCVSGRCVQCVVDSDCPAGFTCDVAAGRCATQGQCFTNRDCTVPDVCNCRTGTCTAPPPPCSSNEDCCQPKYACDVASGQCIIATCQPDHFDPNQDPSSAPVLTSGTYDGLTLCAQVTDGGFSTQGLVDFFAVQLNAGDLLDVTIETDPLLNDTMDVQVLDATQRPLSDGQLATDAVAPVLGTYYIRVSTTDAWVNYSLRLIITQGTPCPTDVYDPNNSIAQATVVPPTTEQLPPQGELSVCPGESDYYKLGISAGQNVTFDVYVVAGQPELDLYVYDSDGVTLIGQSAATAPPQSVTISAAQVSGGVFYAKVVAADPRAQNQYYLSVTYQ